MPSEIKWKIRDDYTKALRESEISKEEYKRLAINFGIVSDSYDEGNRNEADMSNELTDRVLKMLQESFLGKPIRVLLLGCGPGTVEYSILREYGGDDLENVEVHAVDLSAKMLDIAKQYGFNVYVHDMKDRIPKEAPQKYDAIIWMGSFMHVLYPGVSSEEADLQRANLLKRYYDALLPGGQMIIESFYAHGESSAWEYARVPIIDGVPNKEDRLLFYLRDFNLKDLERLGRNAEIPRENVQLFFTDRHATQEGIIYCSIDEIRRNPPPQYEQATMMLINLVK
ncbi:methyltransferase domain-containing protein [Candidatus Woesearchaeota archaeon]|nr:methyltransferase domain-containing protein [Candidatus Woesearchaeota archaeon]